MITKRLTALAAIAVLALVAGCGGGGDSNKKLSYSGFGKAADKVCKSQNSKIDPISQKLTGKAATDGPVYDELVPKLEDARDEFAALKPPAALKSDFDQVNTLIGQQVDLAKQAQTAAKGGDQAGYEQVIAQLRPLSAQTKEAESKLGAAECVKG